MANNSHPIFYFPFHSFIRLGAATLHIIVSTNHGILTKDEISHFKNRRNVHLSWPFDAHCGKMFVVYCKQHCITDRPQWRRAHDPRVVCSIPALATFEDSIHGQGVNTNCASLQSGV